MALSKQETRDLYRKRARRYDHSVWIYRLFGFHIDKYRRLTVDALGLNRGDTVIDLGCGTGLNFPFLQRAVGNDGKIIGVDLTDAMLDVAKARAQSAEWRNVDLVQADVAKYEFPSGVAGVLSTLAITLVAEYETVIRNGAQALRGGGRLAVFDLKEPRDWPNGLIRLAAWMNKPFGVSLEIADLHPWESIRRYLKEIQYKEYYFGALYLSVGERPMD
ncbi:MAG: class I SAM-dependent methyltransferase [Proteobacteria bacterium]|nr:class I SAM-dependent methyltransferase [Pseudomonadota bacterium]